MRADRILMVVDDDEHDRFFLKKSVKEIDPLYSFLEAEHGVEALELLYKQNFRPELIFMDLNMPMMNGLECLKVLKEHEELSSIPVIIYSTSSYQRDIDESIATGALCYITKPTNIDKMVDLIRPAIELALKTSIIPKD